MRQLKKRILDWIEADSADIISFFSSLVQCPTPSTPGDTRHAMRLVEQLLSKHEIKYREVCANEIMPNLVSHIKFNSPGRHLLFNGHLDVMPAGDEPGWNDSPWSGRIFEGKVWGRGTSDMKAGVTGLIFAYIYLYRLREHLSGKLTITLVSDEETGYERGTGYLFEQLEKSMLADCVLSGEPSGTGAISFASKGYAHFTIKIATRGAIAGYANESKNAIELAATLIGQLKAMERNQETPPNMTILFEDATWRKAYARLRGAAEAENLFRTTVDITTISGGSLISVIPSECVFSIALVFPGTANPYEFISRIKEIVASHPEAKLFFDGISMPDFASPDGEMVKILQHTVTDLGLPTPVPVPDIALSDCRHWRYRGIPAYWYGPDGNRCSAANEYVDINDVLHLVRTYTLAACAYLQPETNAPKADQIYCYPQTWKAIKPTLKSLPPVYAACLSQAIKNFKNEDIEQISEFLFGKIYAKLAKEQILPGAGALLVMEEKRHNGRKYLEITAAVPVENAEYSITELEFKVLPSIQLALVQPHYGNTDTSAAWKQLCRFAQNNGYENKGIYREEYLVAYPNPAQSHITELQLPVFKAGE